MTALASSVGSMMTASCDRSCHSTTALQLMLPEGMIWNRRSPLEPANGLSFIALVISQIKGACARPFEGRISYGSSSCTEWKCTNHESRSGRRSTQYAASFAANAQLTEVSKYLWFVWQVLRV